MIPDVTPNGVFYLPPTGWLTSFYNLPKLKFISLTMDKSQDTLFEMLYKAFQYTNGVPKEIWFDNMATVVDHHSSYPGHVKFNEKFLSFSKDAGFKGGECKIFCVNL